MNYDTQYAFSHGLASTPQLQTLQQQHLQQRQHQFQQQQQIFQQQQQQQYGQVAPASNVFLQFAGGSNPMFPQKDIHPVALAAGGMQQTPLGAQSGMVAPSLIKQGVPVRMEGNCVHLVGSSDGVIYGQQPQQPDLKIITANPDARMLQPHSQLDTGLGIPQNTAATLLGIDMMGGQTPHLVDQGSLDLGQQHHHQQQQQGIATIAGQGGMLSYNKQHQFPGPWLQPQQQQQVSSSPGNMQQRAQNSLPSFTHLWSQFQQQKSHAGVGIQQQQQPSINNALQPQQFQNQLHQHHQQQMLSTNPQQQQQFAATAPSFPTLAGVPMINMPHFPQDPSHQQSPLPVLTSQISCFSPCGPSSTPSPCQFVSVTDSTVPNTNMLVQPKACSSVTNVSDSSVPPKVTVILDSLPHCETFPPTTHLQGNSETALKLGASSVISCVDSTSSRPKQRISTSNSQHHHQKKIGVAKPLKPISSTGSSIERSPSESSNFSSPPYAFTPPSSDSLFSPGLPAFHPDEHTLPGSLPETPSSLCLSSSSLSSMSSTSAPSPHQNSSVSVLPVTSGSSTSLVSDGGRCSQHSYAPSTLLSSGSKLTTVATALALSSPSTTTVITAMASSHQLVTTTTTTTSVTLSSHCSNDDPVPSADSLTSQQNPTKASPTVKGGAAKSSVLLHHSTSQQAPPSAEKKVKVPFSWHRKLDNGVIVYLSPSGTALQSYDEICQYLLSDSTCKCGLECPIQVETFFSFDPSVGSQAWSTDMDDGDKLQNEGDKGEDLRKLCNHRREVLAFAALHSSQSQMAAENALLAGKKRDRKKSINGADGLMLSPLKRLKTSITNAVNRHAVSSGNKKICTEGKSNESDTKAGNQKSTSSMSRQLDISSTHSSKMTRNCTYSKDSNSFQAESENSANVIPVMNGENSSFEYDHSDLELQHITSYKNISRQTKMMPVLRSEDSCTSQAKLKTGGQSGCQAQTPTSECNVQVSLQHQTSTNESTDTTSVQNHSQRLENPHSQGLHPCVSPENPNTSTISVHSGNVSSSSGFPTSALAQIAPPKHNTPSSHQSDSQAWPNHVEHSKKTTASVGSPKSKSKRSRPSKREKQRLAFNAEPGSKVDQQEQLSIPSSTVSFMENPTVFVAQQTVIINNSMASCNIAYSSPGPTNPSSSSTYTSSKPQKKKDVPLVHKDDEEEGKTGTDTESNRSLSDTTENDSAYLSQTGSDTIDGSDSCLDSSKASDVYDFNCSEEQEKKPDPSSIVHVNTKAQDTESKTHIGKTTAESSMPDPNISSAFANLNSSEKKTPPSKSKPKSRVPPASAKKEVQPKNGMEDPMKRDSIGSLNKDLSNLLASDNWNIPAVQQVLAQYSGGDPGQLNAAIQQVLAQASSIGVDFPASNLLTAAAKGQLKGNTKKPVNGTSSSNKAISPQVSLPPVSQTAVLQSSAVSKPSTGRQLQQQQQGLGGCPRGGVSVPAATCSQGIPSKDIGGSNNTTESSVFNAVNPECKTVTTATPNPPFPAQRMQAPAASQSMEHGNKLSVPMPPVIASSLAPQSSSAGSTMIVNGLGGSPRMLVNPQMPSVPISMVSSSVSKTVSQVAIGLNQAVFGAVSTPNPQLAQPHLLATAQQQQQNASSTCIINASNQQLVKPATNSVPAPASLQPNNTQHLVAQPAAHQANAPVMNTALSGLNTNQQLLLQQMSPCNPISQLSPAMAAQILTQNQQQQQQQLQQMSPSFLTGNHHQLQKLSQGSVLGNQTSIFASVPLPTFSAAPGSSDGRCLFSQANIPAQQQRSVDNGLTGILSASVDGVDHLAQGLTQVKDVAVSMFAAPAAPSSQPVFVIPPQASANPVVQVLGSAQPLTSATDLSVQQQNSSSLAAQLFGQQQQSQQAAAVDPTQLNNLLAAGFNPLTLQQTINTVNLTGVQQHQHQQQQQQQLQMLQLQSLMLQQLQNQQGQNLQGLPLPGPQAAAPQAIMNAVMPAQGLQLGSMVDMRTIHPSLSPVAAAAATQQSLLGGHLSPAQLRITSSLAAQQTVVPGSSPASVNVLHNTSSLQKVVQPSVKPMACTTSLAPQAQAPSIITTTPEKVAVSASLSTPQESCPPKIFSSAVVALAPETTPPVQAVPQAVAVSPAVSSAAPPTSPASTSSKASSGSSKSAKSKSKSKKSEAKKVVDPESERNEEDIAATVQQILAQAVQQQRELNLAAKNQPPLPTKSKSKKSQSRSRASSNQVPPATPVPAASKEHDLGKLPSIISDDVVLHKPGQISSTDALCASSAVTPLSSSTSLIQPAVPASSFESLSPQSGSGKGRPSQLVQQSPLPVPPLPLQPSVLAPTAARPAHSSQTAGLSPVPQHINYPSGPLPVQTHTFGAASSEANIQSSSCKLDPVEEPRVPTSSMVTSPNSSLSSGVSNKRSTISLKDHLSSIISKDKDNSKKKMIASSSTPRVRGRDSDDKNKATHVTALLQQSDLKVEPISPKVLRKSVK